MLVTYVPPNIHLAVEKVSVVHQLMLVLPTRALAACDSHESCMQNGSHALAHNLNAAVLLERMLGKGILATSEVTAYRGGLISRMYAENVCN